MILSELFESRGGSLYHSMDLKYAGDTIQKDRILATAIQRYDESGRILRDPEFRFGRNRNDVLADPNVPDSDKNAIHAWNNSNWYLGISTTRSLKFAAKWKCVTFELNYAAISQRYKILPWNWRSDKNYKVEREEFIVIQKDSKEYVDSKQFVNPTENNPKLPLSKYLLGIYISQSSWEIYTNDGKKSDPTMDLIQQHPLYKGLIAF